MDDFKSFVRRHTKVIIGSVIGLVVVVLAVIITIIILMKNEKEKQRKKELEEEVNRVAIENRKVTYSYFESTELLANIPQKYLVINTMYDNKTFNDVLKGSFPQKKMLFLLDKDGFVSSANGMGQLTSLGNDESGIVKATLKTTEYKVKWDEDSKQLIMNYDWSFPITNGTRRLQRNRNNHNYVIEGNIYGYYTPAEINELIPWRRKTIRLLPEEFDAIPW